MDTENSWRWKARVVVPLVVLAIGVGVAGLVFGGSALFRFLGRPYSLPLWSLILLALGPVALLAGGIALLWKIHRGPGEMERRPIVVKGVRWRWWTEHNGSLRVVPYCEACDLQLRPREGTDDPHEVLPDFALHCNSCDQETIISGDRSTMPRSSSSTTSCRTCGRNSSFRTPVPETESYLPRGRYSRFERRPSRLHPMRPLLA